MAVFARMTRGVTLLGFYELPEENREPEAKVELSRGSVVVLRRRLGAYTLVDCAVGTLEGAKFWDPDGTAGAWLPLPEDAWEEVSDPLAGWPPPLPAFSGN